MWQAQGVADPDPSWTRVARSGLDTEVWCLGVLSGQGGAVTQVTAVATATRGGECPLRAP